MKLCNLFILLICSCDFYNTVTELTIVNLEPGKLVISSENRYIVMEISTYDNVTISLEKGELYFISHYPIYSSRLSRFPSGAIVEYGLGDVNLSPHLGLLCEIYNSLHQVSIFPTVDDIGFLVKKMNELVDPWIVNREDLILYVSGSIPFSAVTKKSRLVIPELAEYLDWKPENRLFYEWYPSTQSFINPSTGACYHVEVFDNKRYYGFIEVK